MKRILALFLTVALLIPCCPNFAYAANDTTVVSSLAFKLDTSKIDIGDETDSLDNNRVPLTFVPDTSKPNLAIDAINGYCVNSSSTVKVGTVIKMKYEVTIKGSDKDGKTYVVTSSTYPNISMASSTGPRKSSVSKSRAGDTTLNITITLKPFRGKYSDPEDVQWVQTTMSGTNINKETLGQAKWSAPENGNGAGYYDIRLRRNDKSVYTLEGYNATTFNFYPWMDKEGDYTFEVRTKAVSEGSSNSEWTSSDSQYVSAENVSDGSGQGTGTGGSGDGSGTFSVGWKQVNGVWYYLFPDGTLKKNGWEKISNKWYYFDANGAMKTGWITYKNNTFYLDAANGDMKTGWVKTSDGQWYYLHPNANTGTEGAMVKNNWVDYNGKRYYMGSSGAMCTGWTKIGNDFYYFFPTGDDKGVMATNQRIDSFWLDANGRWIKGQ